MSGPELIIIAVLGSAIYFLWRIMKRLGFNGALSLVFLVPVVNLLFLGWLAMTEWPIDKQPRL